MIITSRPFFGKYVTDGDKAVYPKRNRESIPYVRFMVEYGPNEEPVRVLPWCREFHDRFFPTNVAYNDDIRKYPTVSYEIECYIRLLDAFEHDLVKDVYRNVLRYTGTNWATLVRQCGGGVDPAVLASRCSDPRILREAKVLFEIREMMKQTKKARVPIADLPLFNLPTLQTTLANLVEAGIVVATEETLTLDWADMEIKACEGLDTDPEFIHDARRGVVSVGHWHGSKEYDFSRPVHVIVDKGKVPITSVYPPARVEFEYPPLLRNSMSRQAVREEFKVDKGRRRILTVSTTGDMYFEPPNTNLVRVVRRYNGLLPGQTGFLSFERGFYKFERQLEVPASFNRYKISMADAFDCFQCAASCRYSDLYRVPTDSYDAVILVGDPDKQWEREAIRIARGDPTRCSVLTTVYASPAPPPPAAAPAAAAADAAPETPADETPPPTTEVGEEEEEVSSSDDSSSEDEE